MITSLPSALLLSLCTATTFVNAFQLHRPLTFQRHHDTQQKQYQPKPLWYEKSTTAGNYDIMAAYEATSKAREYKEAGALNAAVQHYKLALQCHPSFERTFHLAMAYEENGEPSLAAELYEQCVDQEVDGVLRHDANLKLSHIYAHDLGQVERGIGFIHAALNEGEYMHTHFSNAAAWDQMAFYEADLGHLDIAIDLWEKSINAMNAAADTGTGKGDWDTQEKAAEKVKDARFYQAVARALLGGNDDEEVQNALASLPSDCQHMVESWNYAATHYPPGRLAQQGKQGRIFSGVYTMLHEALSESRPGNGVVAEFGVFHGKSVRLIGDMVGPSVPVDGFDTFEGIPEAWGDEPAGTYTAAAELPQRVPSNVRFHVGLFSDTLPGYVASLPPPQSLPVKLINVDCDLYQGTVEILHYLSNRIGPGTVIIFDEYLMTPTWPYDEYKAFQEACVTFGWTYEYLCFSLFSKQVSVRITSSQSFEGLVELEGEGENNVVQVVELKGLGDALRSSSSVCYNGIGPSAMYLSSL